MITALDTNVLLDILKPNADYVEAAIGALESGSRTGSLTICELVYAEICFQFSEKDQCDEFLGNNKIGVSHVSREACFLASRAWWQYRKQGGPRTRVLPDFLIGAHAELQASRLISRDSKFYRKFYPKLKIIDPSEV